MQAVLTNPMHSGSVTGMTKKLGRDFRKCEQQMWTRRKTVRLLGEFLVPKLAIWTSQGFLPNFSISSFLRSRKISRGRVVSLPNLLSGILINCFGEGRSIWSNGTELHQKGSPLLLKTSSRSGFLRFLSSLGFSFLFLNLLNTVA